MRAPLAVAVTHGMAQDSGRIRGGGTGEAFSKSEGPASGHTERAYAVTLTWFVVLLCDVGAVDPVAC